LTRPQYKDDGKARLRYALKLLNVSDPKPLERFLNINGISLQQEMPAGWREAFYDRPILTQPSTANKPNANGLKPIKNTKALQTPESESKPLTQAAVSVESSSQKVSNNEIVPEAKIKAVKPHSQWRSKSAPPRSASVTKVTADNRGLSRGNVFKDGFIPVMRSEFVYEKNIGPSSDSPTFVGGLKSRTPSPLARSRSNSQSPTNYR